MINNNNNLLREHDKFSLHVIVQFKDLQHFLKKQMYIISISMKITFKEKFVITE